MDLTKLICEKVKEFEATGELDKVVKQNVHDCICEVVKNSFKWNGEAKNSIEEALKGKLAINFNNFTIDRYQKIVVGIVEQQLNETIVSDASENIKAAVNRILQPLEKKEWKLSELMEKFISEIDKSYDGEMEDGSMQGSLFVETCKTTNYKHIYFDESHKNKPYQCKNQIDIDKEGRIYALKYYELHFSPHLATPMNGLQALLFKMYCNNSTLIIDDVDFDMSYCREDYC